MTLSFASLLPVLHAAVTVVAPIVPVVCKHEKSERKCVARALSAGVAALVIGTASPELSLAVEDVRQSTWKCLLDGCRQELAHCLMDPSCAANAVCLETCDPKDLNCQVRCGDVFQDKAVAEFNSCIVTREKCIAQKPDEGEFPVPPECALVTKFSLEDFTGTWYITSGLNPAFDLYDCQVHEFSVAEPGKLTAKLSWRVSLPQGGFFTRQDVQHFSQSPTLQGHFENHGNQYLNYSDDWYVLSSKLEHELDDYVFVYYRGTNDAWDGYGGAIVYTRAASLPGSIVPELRLAAAKIGLDFGKFKNTNNTCKAST